MTQRISHNQSRPRGRYGRQRLKLRGAPLNAYYKHYRKVGDHVSDYWSLNKKGKGKKFERNISSFDLTLPTTGNQINIAESSQGEVISLIGSSTREILYSAKYAQTWLLDSGTIFHLTRHKEWFSNYSISVGSI